MFKHNLEIILLIILTFSSKTNAQETYEDCITPANENGICVRAVKCSIFDDYFLNPRPQLTPNFYDYWNKSSCGFIGSENYVCCAFRHLNNNTKGQSIENGSIIFPSNEKKNENTVLTIQQPIPQPLQQVSPESHETSTLPSNFSPDDSRFGSPSTVHRNLHFLTENKCGPLSGESKLSFANKTDLNEYPWMVLLRYETSNGLEFKCGGTLITPRYVLTAAHCIQTQDRLVSVRLGEHDWTTELDCDEIDDYCAPPVQDIELNELISHPHFRKGKIGNDIGLLRLKYPADLSEDNVKTICLPTNPMLVDLEKKTGIVSGWGYTEKTNSLSNELLQASVPIVPNSRCADIYKRTLSNAEICAGGENFVDTCRGDSGGPLFFSVKLNADDLFPRMMQVGIISSGFTQCGQINSFTMFTRVSRYMTWILDNLY